MERRVLAIVLLLVLAVLAFLGYHSYDARHTVATVAQRDSTAESKQEPAPSSTATPQPGSGQTTQPAQPVQSAELPATGDTISPNPPSGVLFTGSGRYQLYRQGNITWRLDTDTGHTCVIFATDEEWAKPRVYRSGCAKN